MMDRLAFLLEEARHLMFFGALVIICYGLDCSAAAIVLMLFGTLTWPRRRGDRGE